MPEASAPDPRRQAARVLRNVSTELYWACDVQDRGADGWELDVGHGALTSVQDQLVHLDGEAAMRFRGAVGALHAVLQVIDAQNGIRSEPTTVVHPD